MKENQIFFAISRDNLHLQRTFQVSLYPFINGEFCGFFFDAEERRIVFGRDIFGRKSLCWRVGMFGEESSNCIFELSVFPGGTQLNNQKSDGWREVPPGTLCRIQLPPNAFIRTSTNSKLGPKFACPILDFYSEMDCTMEEFTSQEIFVRSFYPPHHFAQNPFFQTFKSVDFSPLGSDILLQPRQAQPSKAPDEAQISLFTSEFLLRFFTAVRVIFRDAVKVRDYAHFDVPVLFSGGVDSLMVALSVGDVLCRLNQSLFDENAQFRGKIRLFSVAFGKNEEECSEAPDRSQSIIAFEHLRQRALKKHGFNPYQLVLIDVSGQELAEFRQQHIADAIYPSNTVLDDSIGCVLWFATRMCGVEYLPGGDRGEQIEDHTPFVLVGSGSDEQLGGYARHRTCFENGGLEALTAELSMEMHRIGQRNFGRDDRVGMSNGRAILAPFLEEPLVCWLNNVPTAMKTGFSLPAVGGSNKFLLRNALRSLGMPELVVERPKRAMQFGTRIAKLDRVAGQKGSDICQRLLPQTNLNE